MDHLLLYCKFAYALWSEVFLMFGVQWVMLNTIVSLLFAWRNWLGTFFYIGNKNSINQDDKKKKANTRCSWWWTQEKATNNNKEKNLRDDSKRRKKLNDRRTIQGTLAPRPIKRVLWHRVCNWTNDFSVSLKERQFLSIQTIHTKQPGTLFQMSE